MVSHSFQTHEITVNGERRQVPAGLTLRDLLLHLQVQPDRVAVELNRRIVRQREWDSTCVQAGSELEIVQFVGGG
jgi:thiamine biosynthesis protein ThiS